MYFLAKTFEFLQKTKKVQTFFFFFFTSHRLFQKSWDTEMYEQICLFIEQGEPAEKMLILLKCKQLQMQR